MRAEGEDDAAVDAAGDADDRAAAAEPAADRVADEVVDPLEPRVRIEASKSANGSSSRAVRALDDSGARRDRVEVLGHEVVVRNLDS